MYFVRVLLISEKVCEHNMKKALTVKQLIKQLKKFPQDATVRIFDKQLCPDADYYVIQAECQSYNSANEVDLLLKREN